MKFLRSRGLHRSLGLMLGLIVPNSCLVESQSVGQERVEQPWKMKQVEIDEVVFEIPEFCTLEKVTTPEESHWPIVATFAPDGGLIVAESVWNMQSKETVQQQLVSRPHRLVRLRDLDFDGHYESRQVIAQGLSFPEGVLAIGKDIYVTAPPEIWKFTDADGDGVCEEREVWFDGKTLTGCANDLHGPWLGPDGWIYWSKSAFAEQTHPILSDVPWEGLPRRDKPWTSKASHLYRRHPHGGAIDPVMTGGMDNLVDVAWLPNGDRFFCATFLHHPRNAVRDGIGAATYGALFGKPHAVLDGHPRTGALMEPTVELGPAAPAGLMALESIVPPGIVDPELGALLCAQFNLHQISLHPLRRDGQGAGYQAASIPILRTERIDFHPVDVLLDSDASILIVDTGGWYDLCCPSSGTDQRVADGGIYRLKGLTNECRSWAEHLRLDPKDVAFDALADQAQKTIEEDSHGNTGWNKRRMLTDLSDAFTRFGVNAPVDAKSRLEGIVRRGVTDSDESVSLFAMHFAALHRLDGARDVALRMLKDSSAVKRRGAAEWLGRIGIDTEVPVVLEVLRDSHGDRSLQHSLLYALIEGAKPQALENAWASNAQLVGEGFGESSESFADTVALLRVLDGRAKLDAIHVRGLWWCALSTNREVADFGFDAIERHPQWLPELLENVKAWESSSVSESVETKELNSQQVYAISRLIARWSDKPEVVEWVAERFRSPVESSQKSFELSLGILESMRSRAMPAQWGLPVSQWLGNASSQVRDRLRDTLRGAQWKGDAKEFSHVVLAIIDQLANSKVDDRTEIEKDIEQLQWLALIPKGTEISADSEALVLRAAMGESALGERSESEVQRQVQRQALGWEILPNLRLVRPESRNQLVEGLPTLGVLQLPKVMEAYLRGADDSQEDRLIETMNRLAASKSLSMEGTVTLLGSLGRQSQGKWKEAFLSWQQPREDVRAGVDRWMAKLQPGDARRGYQVFRSSKATCSACHQVGYVGGNVGPVLSRIGQSRSRRELLEAILYPSARLEQAYQGTKVRLVEGEVVQGLVVTETASELELQVSADVRRRISKGDIEAREASLVSIMPLGLENQLSIEELSDVIAFLENAK